MLENTVFSLAGATPEQVIAFFSFSAFMIGFFVWVYRLWAQK
jgi:hypothetical protein